MSEDLADKEIVEPKDLVKTETGKKAKVLSEKIGDLEFRTGLEDLIHRKLILASDGITVNELHRLTGFREDKIRDFLEDDSHCKQIGDGSWVFDMGGDDSE